MHHTLSKFIYLFRGKIELQRYEDDASKPAHAA